MESPFLKEMRLKCVECDKTVLDSDDFVEIHMPGALWRNGIARIHRECKRERDEREEQVRRKSREEYERLMRERDEEEHSLRPGSWRLHLHKGCYGLKKDFEVFEKEANDMIEALAKKHNLNNEKKD
jgi:hypothetical protein